MPLLVCPHVILGEQKCLPKAWKGSFPSRKYWVPMSGHAVETLVFSHRDTYFKKRNQDNLNKYSSRRETTPPVDGKPLLQTGNHPSRRETNHEHRPIWAHTGPIWSNFARCGSKIEFLIKFLDDSASCLLEKLKNHVILTKNINI